MKNTIHISKLDVAKRELEHAIRLFFLSGDPIIIHLNASSAQEVLRDLCRSKNISSFVNGMSEIIREDKRKEVMKIFKKPYNFMKHADKDPDGIIEFNPTVNRITIWDCVDMYNHLTGEMTGLMQSYRGWFYASNPNFLLNKEDQLQYQKLAENMDLQDKSLFLDLADQLERIRTK